MPDPSVGQSRVTELELFEALMTAIKRLEEAGRKTDDLRAVANRAADPYVCADPVKWSPTTVEEAARALYERWRLQGLRLGLESKPDGPAWHDTTEYQRHDYRQLARQELDRIVKEHNK